MILNVATFKSAQVPWTYFLLLKYDKYSEINSILIDIIGH